MSFTVDLIPGGLPEDEKEAWKTLEEMRKSYYDDSSQKEDRLIQLHNILTKKYPCLCSYDDDDPEMDNSPWADGPMIDNFASKMGMLAVVYSKVDEVIPFILESALSLGITVVDGQSEKIYRPLDKSKTQKKQPWWRF